MDYVSIITDDQLFNLTDWISVFNRLKSHQLKKGNDCLGKDEILCQLIIFQNSTFSELALMLSINHMIADGVTFYHIWKMLDKNEVINSMKIERVHEFEDFIKRDTNIPISTDMSALRVLSEAFKLISRGVGRKVQGRSAPRMYMYKVNAEAIKKRKAESDSFVSTNDILSSWIGSLLTNGIHLAINSRDRIAELTKEMAGNYQTAIPMNMSTIDGPKDFRERWTKVLAKEIPVDKATE